VRVIYRKIWYIIVNNLTKLKLLYLTGDRDSSVGIATR
jgi:hypothetical protein